METNKRMAQGRARERWSRHALASVVALSGVAMGWLGSLEAARADDHVADRAEYELLESRVDVIRALRDDMTAQMAAAFGLAAPEDVAAAAASRVEAVERGYADLVSIDVDPGIDSERHELLVDTFERMIPAGENAAPFTIYNGATELEFAAILPFNPLPTPVQAMQHLVWVENGPQYVFQELLIAEFGFADTAPAPGLTEFSTSQGHSSRARARSMDLTARTRWPVQAMHRTASWRSSRMRWKRWRTS